MKDRGLQVQAGIGEGQFPVDLGVGKGIDAAASPFPEVIAGTEAGQESGVRLPQVDPGPAGRQFAAPQVGVLFQRYGNTFLKAERKRILL